LSKTDCNVAGKLQAFLALAALLLAAGCSPMEVACTEIGAPPGVGVTVERAIAPDVEAVRLTVCWDGKCDDHEVQLFAGSDTADQGCNGIDTNSACSATAVPNGTKVGFAEVPGLPTGTITIGATVRRADKDRVLPKINVQAEPTYPNGPQCGPQGPQARVVLGASGLR
jgi:hypothetical protein